MKLLHRLICVMAISLLVTVPALAAQEIGSVSEVLGDVDILRGGKLPAETAKVGAKVAQGDVIRTKSGGKVQLNFKDDSALTIAPDSRVALNEYVYEPETNKREASIKIFQGLVHTVVNKVIKKDTPDFTVETQTAVIGVRGTDYFTLVGPAISDIYNNSGTTEIRNVFAEIPGKVTLRGREYTKVSKNLPPTLPLPLTQDDINWIRGQMTPKMVAKSTGSGSTNPQQLMSNVAGGAVRTSNVSTPTPTVVTPTQTNVIQNLQSAVYVPPQPVPLAALSPQPVPARFALPTPFNISVLWGSIGGGDLDLDLYVTTVPNGTTVYYGSPGSPTTFYLTGDSVVNNGGEVVVVNNWTPGQTYYAYVKNFTNPTNTGGEFSGATMQFSKGGTPVTATTSAGGTYYKVDGATPIGSSLSPPTPTTTNQGSQWQVASINPSTGTITPLNQLVGYDAPLPTTAAATVPATNAPALVSPTMMNSTAATATSRATTVMPAAASATRPATTVMPAAASATRPATTMMPATTAVAPVKTTAIPTATTMAPTPSAAATVVR